MAKSAAKEKPIKVDSWAQQFARRVELALIRRNFGEAITVIESAKLDYEERSNGDSLGNHDPLHVLAIDQEPINHLNRFGVFTVPDLRKVSFEAVRARGFGPKVWRQVQEALEDYDRLRESAEGD